VVNATARRHTPGAKKVLREPREGPENLGRRMSWRSDIMNASNNDTIPETTPETTRGPSPEALGPPLLGPGCLWRRSSGRLGSRFGSRIERVES